jgi:hypothetical protein
MLAELLLQCSRFADFQRTTQLPIKPNGWLINASSYTAIKNALVALRTALLAGTRSFDETVFRAQMIWNIMTDRRFESIVEFENQFFLWLWHGAPSV